MVLGLEGCLFWCTYRPTKLITEIGYILKSHSRSTRLLVGALIFNKRGMIFPGCRPTVKVSIWADHGSNMFGVSNNLHLTELFAIYRDSCPQRITILGAILNPAAFAIVQIEARCGIHRTKCWCQRSQLILKKRVMQQRDCRRKCTGQAAQIPSCLASSG